MLSFYQQSAIGSDMNEVMSIMSASNFSVASGLSRSSRQFMSPDPAKRLGLAWRSRSKRGSLRAGSLRALVPLPKVNSLGDAAKKAR